MNRLNPFYSIRILTRCEVFLCQDSYCAVEVVEPDDIAHWIDWHVKNDELVIQTRPADYGLLLLSGSYPRIRVTCTDLEGILLVDNARVITPQEIQVERLGVVIYRDGTATLHVDALRMDCTILKNGYLKVRGETAETFLHLYRNGRYDGASLGASSGKVYLTDNTQASVWIDGEMEARILRKSSLLYRGAPRLSWLSVDEGSRIEPLKPARKEKLIR